MSRTVEPAPRLRAARDAVGLSFVLNGLCFATWVSRIPEARASLGLSNSALGLLLLALAAGSVLALPTTGGLVQRFGTVRVVRAGGLFATVGLLVAALAMPAGVAPVAVGLFLYGIGTGVWDVSMNVEGATVEQGLGRSVLPRFHAGFSLGTVSGALLGAAVVYLEVPIGWHLPVVALVSLGLMWPSSGRFLPALDQPPGRPSWHAWREPRTVAIGVLVLAMALAEGTANDWLAVALVDGYDVAHWVGVAGFATFVCAMTAGRLLGGGLLDRLGRSVVLWSTMVTAGVGVVLIVVGPHPLLVVLGIVLWGLGASLGFPVGISAAADDPQHAAARVSVVSTIGYGAFLAGPPLLGFLGDRVGTLTALLVVAVALLPAAVAVPATRQRPVTR